MPTRKIPPGRTFMVGLNSHGPIAAGAAADIVAPLADHGEWFVALSVEMPPEDQGYFKVRGAGAGPIAPGGSVRVRVENIGDAERAFLAAVVGRMCTKRAAAAWARGTD